MRSASVPSTRPRAVSGSTAQPGSGPSASANCGSPEAVTAATRSASRSGVGRRAAGVGEQTGRADLQAYRGPLGDLGHHPVDQPPRPVAAAGGSPPARGSSRPGTWPGPRGGGRRRTAGPGPAPAPACWPSSRTTRSSLSVSSCGSAKLNASTPSTSAIDRVVRPGRWSAAAAPRRSGRPGAWSRPARRSAARPRRPSRSRADRRASATSATAREEDRGMSSRSTAGVGAGDRHEQVAIRVDQPDAAAGRRRTPDPGARTTASATSASVGAAARSATICCRTRTRFSDDSAARRAASSSRSYPRRSVALKTVVRITRGMPAGSRPSTELTSVGSRRPSAQTTSKATSCTSSCMLSSGA